MGRFEHRIETVIPHHEWDEAKVVIEQDGRDASPKIELTVDRQHVTLTLDELAEINAIVESYKKASRIMQGETDV